MTISYGPKLGLLENAATGEVHDDAFRKFLRGMDGMTQLSVKDKDLSTPPGSPVNGDCYLIAASPTPTGAWAGGANKIARYSSHAAAWELWTPYEGWICWVQDEDIEYRYNGTIWSLNALAATSLQFSTTSAAPAHNPGLVYWDKDLKCMAYHAVVAGVSNQVGEELWVRAYNNTGSLIPNGSVVYISGAHAGLPTMALADATTLSKCGAVGMVTHDVAASSEGFVTRFGMVRGLNTNGLTDGAPVYLSATTPGAWTTTAPTTGYVCVVGAIAYAAPAGVIYVRPHPPLALADDLGGATPSDLVAPTQAAAKAYVDPLYVVGTDTFFVSGFVSRADNTLTLATRTLTVAPTGASFAYYRNNIKITKTGGATCQVTIPATVGQHFVYFDATNQLVSSMTPWSIPSGDIYVATIYWNGTAGAVNDERHQAGRDLEWHGWAHSTIGARYESGLVQTYPTTANDGRLQLESGQIRDEDIVFVIAQQKRCRLWYQTASAAWTWANGTDNGGFDRPYLWNAATSRLRFPESDNSYTLADVAANNYVCVWVYATTDTDRPIYLVIPALAAAYGNLSAARAEGQPSTAGMLTAELKLLYRWIFSGDGQYQEGVDYRNASSLPAGGTPTIQHNDTLNKQGGTSGEYYHLTSAQNTLAASILAATHIFQNKVNINDATDAATTTDGSLQTDGGLSVVKNAVIGGTAKTGPMTIIGTAGTDLPAFSAELLTSSGWTSTGWTGDFASGWTHTTGNTTALTNTLAAVIGNKYQIAYTITGRTAGSAVITFGGQSVTVTATSGFGPTATTTDALAITPTTDFNGTVLISIKQITAGSSAALLLADSWSAIKIECRAQGGDNSAMGKSALFYNTTGSNNNAVGTNALYSNTTGSNNNAVGINALRYNTTGSNNNAFGANALYSNTTGSNNNAVGFNALRYNTTGYNNSAVGTSALYSNTTGYYNSAVGVGALFYNTTGTDNSAVGVSALYNNTTGNNNSAVGYNTGLGVTTGSNNTILGANVTGLAAATTDNIVIATGQGTKRLHFNGSTWAFLLANVPAYANNTAAIAGGLSAGAIYRTGGDPDQLCIVH